MSTFADEIAGALTDIEYTGALTDVQVLSASLSSSSITAEFTQLVAYLVDEIRALNALEESVHSINNEEGLQSFLMELSSFLKELASGCPIPILSSGPSSQRLSTEEQRACLLSYLIGELQSESSDAAALRLILQSLDFPKPPANITIEHLFSKLIPTLVERMGKFPSGSLYRPLFFGVLSDKQWKLLTETNEQMKADYKTRSALLLKRLDVTIQSFAWSDRVKKMEDKLLALYRPLRLSMLPESMVNISDLLAARDDVKLVEKTSGTRARENTKSKVNKVRMTGRVPDRGGRPTEIQAPPPEMPSWQKNRAAPAPRGGGGGGQRGGNQRGGRGGGGSGRGRSGLDMQQQNSYDRLRQFERPQAGAAGGNWSGQATGGYQQSNGASNQAGFQFSQSAQLQGTFQYQSQQQFYQQPQMYQQPTNGSGGYNNQYDNYQRQGQQQRGRGGGGYGGRGRY